MGWNTVLNQQRVKEILISSMKRNRIAHAYLFTGPEGVGKYAAAFEFAKAVVCEAGKTEACGECRTCRGVQMLQHPSLSLITALPVGKGESAGDAPLTKLSLDEVALVQEQLTLKAANPYHLISIPRASEIKISSVREIRRETSLTTFSGKKKVFIVLDADKMNDAAANALLKTLEEPRENVLLILTSAFPDQLLPTIRSRCQQLRFDPLSEEVIRQALQGRNNVDPDQADLISRLSNGSYSRALRYVHEDLNERRLQAIEYLRIILHRSRKEQLEKIEELVSEFEKYELEEFLRLLQLWLREAMLMKHGAAGDRNDEALQKFVHHYPSFDAARAIGAIERAVSLLGKNVYIPLILMELSFQLRNSIRSSVPASGPAGTADSER